MSVDLRLGFGKCTLALLVPEEHKDAPLSAYVGSRVVTSFPNIAKKFFAPLDAAATALQNTAGGPRANEGPRPLRPQTWLPTSAARR